MTDQVQTNQRARSGIEILLDLNRNELLNAVSTASNVETFDMASRAAWSNVLDDQIDQFKKTKEYQTLVQKKNKKIHEANKTYKTSSTQAAILQKKLDFWNNKKSLNNWYLFFALVVYLPLSFISGAYRFNNFGVMMILAILLFGYFILVKVQQSKIEEYEPKVLQLSYIGKGLAKQIEHQYNEKIAEIAFENYPQNIKLVDQYNELQEAEEVAENYRQVFPEKYQNEASLKLLEVFLKEGSATTWQEAAFLYESEESTQRLIDIQNQIAHEVNQVLSKNYQNAKIALAELKQSYETGQSMKMDQALQIQSDNMRMYAEIRSAVLTGK